jgi:hypothetical protein
LAQALPKEPAETEPNIITIRYRAPDGELLERRFRPVESIEMAVIYAETKGYDHEHYRLFTSDRPRKEVGLLFCSHFLFNYTNKFTTGFQTGHFQIVRRIGLVQEGANHH